MNLHAQCSCRGQNFRWKCRSVPGEKSVMNRPLRDQSSVVWRHELTSAAKLTSRDEGRIFTARVLWSYGCSVVTASLLHREISGSWSMKVILWSAQNKENTSTLLLVTQLVVWGIRTDFCQSNANALSSIWPYQVITFLLIIQFIQTSACWSSTVCACLHI